MDNKTLKEMSPMTILVWAAYTVFALIMFLAQPAVNIPFTSLRLIPAITMLLLLTGLVLGVIDTVKILKKQRAAMDTNEEPKPSGKA